MKFSDLRPGMVVKFDHHDADNWAAFHEDLMRSPNYHGPANWFASNYRKYEGIPLTVKSIRTVSPHGYQYQVLNAYVPQGKATLSEHWFQPDDENAFIELKKGVNEQIRTEPRKSSKTKKKMVLGELKAMPGAVDYNDASERFGKGCRTRRRRHR
jgi:hypothetical protein